MKVSVAVLSWNRRALLERTLYSLCERAEHPLRLHVVDNGSTDGSQDLVRRLSFGWCNRDGNTTAGHGMNLAIGRALADAPDLVVFSADDYEYRPGWLRRLVRFYQAAPGDVALVSCNLEPDYPWNQVRGVVDAGGERALVRESLPGSSWAFGAALWPQIGPVSERTGGEDLEVCTRLRVQGYRLCALDLSEHVGERCSSWGNASWTAARPLDRARWGLPPGGGQSV